MNPTMITIIIATATFIVSIFGAPQFYSSRMEKYIDAKVDGLRGEMNAGFAAVRAEIATQSARISDASGRIERIERQLDAMFKPISPGRGARNSPQQGA